jgi:hypothetical protein
MKKKNKAIGGQKALVWAAPTAVGWSTLARELFSKEK